MYYLISTLGCRLNQAQSAQIEEKLLNYNLLPAKSRPPDIIIINTCVVTKKAERESRKVIRKLKRTYPKAKIVLTGCLANLYKNKKPKNLKIDFLIPNENKKDLPKILNLKPQKLTQTPSFLFDKYPSGGRKLIPIQTGCNNFCTYCIVPYLRPSPSSRPVGKIISQINSLPQNIFEVILTGINLSLFKPSLSFLLTHLLKKTTIKRIRFGSININCFSDQFINLYQSPRLCPHFHIPLQSGSDKILKLMKRPYNTNNYLKTIKKIRRQIPHVNITTDIIVGFPSETKSDFKKTLNLCQKLQFSKVHIFRYSPRPQTQASNLKPQVPEKIKKIRTQKLTQKTKKVSQKVLSSQIGKTHQVLLEEKIGDYHRGYTKNYFNVYLKSKKPYQTKIVKVKIKAVQNNHLIAVLDKKNSS